MLRHVVLFRWTDAADAAARAAIEVALATLPARISEISAYRFGADAGLAAGNWDFAVVADFRDQAAYEVYRDHPAHRAVIAERIAPFIAERAAVQLALEG